MREVTPDRRTVIERLAKSRLFKHLSEQQIERIANRADFLHYERGERIIDEHSVDDSLYVILNGNVSVHVKRDERDVYITTLGPADIFGESGVFVNLQRTASVYSTDGTTLLRIRRASFMTALADDPRAGMKILLVMVYSLLRKLREVNVELAFERASEADQDSVDLLVEQMMPSDAREMLE